jgi:hypothetical protein
MDLILAWMTVDQLQPSQHRPSLIGQALLP